MAWLFGNDVSGQRLAVMGRVMVEILYAINEREFYMHQTETEWDTIGSYPAAPDLDGITFNEIAAYVIAARRAIDGLDPGGENLVSRTLGASTITSTKNNTTWEPYADVEDLLTTVLGYDAWASGDGELRYGDATIFNELMEVVEVLKYWDWDAGGVSFEHIFDTDGFGVVDVDTIHANAVANGTPGGAAIFPIPGGPLAWFLYAVTPPNNYYTYYNYFAYTGFPAGNNITPDAVEIHMDFDVDAFGIGGATKTDNTIILRKVTTPGTEDEWAPAGTTLGTLALTVADIANNVTWEETIGAIDFDVINVFQVNNGPNNPFANDPGESQRAMGIIFYHHITIRYFNTVWTYE